VLKKLESIDKVNLSRFKTNTKNLKNTEAFRRTM